MHFVYIIYSRRTDRFYVGETPDFIARLAFHNDPEKNDNTTRKGIPWEEFWKYDVGNIRAGRRIEKHIKSMKSRRYYYSLRDYPEVIERLLNQYKGVPGSPR